jgi:hypothetical protein
LTAIHVLSFLHHDHMFRSRLHRFLEKFHLEALLIKHSIHVETMRSPVATGDSPTTGCHHIQQALPTCWEKFMLPFFFFWEETKHAR